MQQPHRGPGPLTRRPGAGATWRLALVLSLLAVGAFGARAREVTHLSSSGLLDPRKPVTFVLGVVFIVLGALAAVAVVVGLVQALSRRGQPGVAVEADDVRLPWWVRLLLALAALSLVALLITVLVLILRHTRRRTPQHLPSLLGTPRSVPASQHTGTLTAMLLTSLAVLLVLAFAWFWRWRRRRARGWAGTAATEPSELATAVSAARQALRVPRSAREAIIACYAAMEDTLAAAGTARKPADTPDELLRRAAGEGLLHTSAAGRLTTLFREARFSPHPVGDAERDDATAALDEIGRDLAAQP